MLGRVRKLVVIVRGAVVSNLWRGGLLKRYTARRMIRIELKSVRNMYRIRNDKEVARLPKEYQPKRNNSHYMNHNIYMQMKYLLENYPNLKEKHLISSHFAVEPDPHLVFSVSTEYRFRPERELQYSSSEH